MGMISELDDVEKAGLLDIVIDRARNVFNDGKPLTEMRYWHEFTIGVTLKINQGKFGIRYDRQGEFTFCARSRDDARAIAGHHVKGERFSIDTTRMIEIIGAISIGDPHGEAK